MTLDQREKCEVCIYKNSDNACVLITKFGTPTPCDYIIVCGSFKNKHEKKIKEENK